MMKKTMLGMLALLALAPAAFAQSWCEESCCDEANGNWDSDALECFNGGAEFTDCKNEWCSHEVPSGAPVPDYDYDAGSGSGGSVTCCGSAFILAAIGGLAFLRPGRGAVS